MSEAFMTRAETENVLQAFGMRLIDWARMPDEEAGQHMTELVRKQGFEAFQNALNRVRSLAGKPRMIWLTAICSLGHPQIPNLIKNPPDMNDDEVWRLAFAAMLLDERRKEDAAMQKRLLQQTIAEQA